MSVHLFRRGNVWTYRFQINGVRVQRSTRETVKHVAEAIAERAYRHAKMWARGDEPPVTLKQLADLWLSSHESLVSPHYIRLVSTFARLHLYALSDVPIDELTTPLVEAALLEHRRGRAVSTCNYWLIILRMLGKYAVRRKLIPELPWKVKLMKVQQRPRAILPLSRVTEWLAAVDDYARTRPEISTAVRLMAGLGLRESEVLSARAEWLNWERRTYTPGVTKSRSTIPLPVPPWLIEYLRPLCGSTGLIVSRPDGRPCAPGFTRRAMLAANQATGIGHVTAHRIRATYATTLSEAGLPIQTVQLLLRHASPLTSMRYLEINLQQAIDVQAVIAQKAGLQAKPECDGAELAHTTPQTSME
jgi:integrase/recombinase XerC